MADSQRRVVIAMDGSHFSAYAFHWYIQNIHKKKDYVILVHSQELHFCFTGRSPEPSAVLARYEEASKKSQELIASLQQRIKDDGLTGAVMFVHGEPGHAVIKVAEEEDADLIVTGCRGQGTIRRTFMGSVSDYIIHHSSVPVIVCRHKEHCFQHRHNPKHHD